MDGLASSLAAGKEVVLVFGAHPSACFFPADQLTATGAALRQLLEM